MAAHLPGVVMSTLVRSRRARPTLLYVTITARLLEGFGALVGEYIGRLSGDDGGLVIVERGPRTHYHGLLLVRDEEQVVQRWRELAGERAMPVDTRPAGSYREAWRAWCAGESSDLSEHLRRIVGYVTKGCGAASLRSANDYIASGVFASTLAALRERVAEDLHAAAADSAARVCRRAQCGKPLAEEKRADASWCSPQCRKAAAAAARRARERAEREADREARAWREQGERAGQDYAREAREALAS